MKRKSLRRLLLRSGVQFAVLALVCWFAYPYFDLERVRVALERLPIHTALGFLSLMLMVRLINSWRWYDIAVNTLSLSVPSVWFMTRVTLLAQFTNIWFPSFLGGEGVRVWKVARATEMSKDVPLSVMLDRVVGITSLGLLSTPLLFLFPHFMPEIERALESPMLAWGGVAFVALLAAALFWKRKMFLGIARRVAGFFLEHNFLMRPIAISALGLLTILGAYWFLLNSLQDGSLIDVAALTLIPRFGRLFPISALGVGVVEGGTLVVGGYLGFDPQMLVIVVSMHVTSKYVAAALGLALEAAYGGSKAIGELFEHTNSESGTHSESGKTKETVLEPDP